MVDTGRELFRSTTCGSFRIPFARIRISSGLVDKVNSTVNQYFLRITDDAGYAAYGGQTFVAVMDYHTTQEEYERRVAAPWPAATPGMLINGEHRPASGPPGAALLGPQPPEKPKGPTRKPTRLNK